MAKKLTLLISSVLACTYMANAQNRTVTGTVKDSQGKPIPQVSIKLKNQLGGTTTDAQGRFSLAVNPNMVIVLSSVGFQNKEQVVNDQTTLNITLESGNTELTEVVVIGYGTVSRKDLTGSIASVKAEQLENENPQSVADLLKGNIAGLSVSQNTSAKGGGDLLVRGKTTLSASTSPLIVLDGIIYNGQLSDINPNDIQTIDVLKDASSLAVYGAKAATGAIAITTKKGSSDKPVLTVNTNWGLASLAQNQPVYNGLDFLRWRADVGRATGSRPAYFYDDPRNLSAGVTYDQWIADGNKDGDPVDIWLDRLGLVANEKANYYAGKTEDWYNGIFRTGIRQDHSVSMSGRKEDINYYMSFGYNKNQNLIEGGEFSNFRTRLNLEGKITSFLSIGANAQFASRDEGAIEADWGQLLNLSPYGDKYNADGTLRRIPTDDNGLNARNPFLNMTYNDRMQKQNTLFASMFAKINLPFGISYQFNFSPGLDSYRTFNHESSENPNVTIKGGIANRAQETRYNWQIDNLLKWNRQFADIHRFDVTLLANSEKYQTWWTQAANQGFVPGDFLGYHNLASGVLPSVSADDKVYTADALMARVNYTLMDRYNLSISTRRDGYSVFGANKKRAVFPAVAAAWTFSEESFLKNSSWLNYAKLRLSYGINGNRDIRNPDNGTVDPYAALGDLQTGKYQNVNGSGAATDVNTAVKGNRMPNANLKWEETTSLNAGLDFSLFKDRISGAIDVYAKTTKDLLVRQSLPDVIGYQYVFSNLAEVKNKGFEFSLSSRNLVDGNVRWNSNLVFSLNRNKIVKLATENDDLGNGWFIGQDIDVIWDYKIVGVWQENEMDEAKKFTKAGIKPGDFKLEDVNGDYLYTDADRKFIGYETPRFTWALRNEFNVFKNFDFSFQLISNIGQKKQFNQAKNNPGSVGFMRSNSYVLPYWTPENPSNDYARLGSGTNATTFNVYWNNSFIRLNNVSLAYTLPKATAERIKLRGLKVYMNVNNAAVYTPVWNYWDPQNNGPTPRYYTLGLNMSL
ncbi:SusC/RagA family TonB-linked outer membrane protein [Sphingobacterium sp.]|uniref:SusC/RagA family TonB-linked outer membrane protein n=1 Tax=Sphingobacterium sp. TaxID=341027 RepID=UPI0028A2B942|nr:SusC/RagA family TonB-linked outer membrane protein [Sphingobacterium sp.]